MQILYKFVGVVYHIFHKFSPQRLFAPLVDWKGIREIKGKLLKVTQIMQVSLDVADEYSCVERMQRGRTDWCAPLICV